MIKSAIFRNSIPTITNKPVAGGSAVVLPRTSFTTTIAMASPLGSFEELVLLSACGLGEEAYAVSIHERIVDKGGRDASMGAVYTALDRLEQKGYLKSRLGAVTPTQGGRRKRYYDVTGSGLKALSTVRSVRQSLRDLIDARVQPGFES